MWSMQVASTIMLRWLNLFSDSEKYYEHGTRSFTSVQKNIFKIILPTLSELYNALVLPGFDLCADWYDVRNSFHSRS